MVLPRYSFLGIGTEQGQRKAGLLKSPLKALQLMPESWPIEESTLLTQSDECVPIHDCDQLNRLNWNIYHRAYLYNCQNLALGRRQINWGGDHSVALSSVAAFLKLFPDGHILWIDAHADLNTPSSSLTGNFHGMPLSVLLGVGQKSSGPVADFWGVLRPEQLIYLGLRDLDAFERDTINKLEIKAYFCEDLEERDFPHHLTQLRKAIENRPLHVSFDIDSVDPNEAPSTGVKAIDGLSKRQIQKLAQMISEIGNLNSVDIVEINPSLGTAKDVQRTYEIAFSFIEKLFNFERENSHATIIYKHQKDLPIQNPWNTPFWP